MRSTVQQTRMHAQKHSWLGETLGPWIEYIEIFAQRVISAFSIFFNGLNLLDLEKHMLLIIKK